VAKVRISTSRTVLGWATAIKRGSSVLELNLSICIIGFSKEQAAGTEFTNTSIKIHVTENDSLMLGFECHCVEGV